MHNLRVIYNCLPYNYVNEARDMCLKSSNNELIEK